MSSKSTRSLRSKKEELGSHSRHDKLKIPMETQLQSYTDHYDVTWHEKKREFVNAPINSYDSLRSVGHIIIGEVRKVTTTSDTLSSFEESPWSKLYEKRYELQVYCRWHELRVSKPRSAELPREDSMMILDQLEREIKQMQR
ncbi:cystathionine beta-lyase, chloroplastic-like [Fagus crenata]